MEHQRDVGLADLFTSKQESILQLVRGLCNLNMKCMELLSLVYF